MFVRGEKPKELARISKISARRWEQYENHCKRENPMLQGLRFLRVFEQESVKTYAHAAELLGVSRQRVYQLTSLVTRLPEEIKDFLLANEDPAILRYFTERRLRPLTRLTDNDDQLAEFKTIRARARQTGRPSGTRGGGMWLPTPAAGGKRWQHNLNPLLRERSTCAGDPPHGHVLQ